MVAVFAVVVAPVDALSVFRPLLLLLLPQRLTAASSTNASVVLKADAAAFSPGPPAGKRE